MTGCSKSYFAQRWWFWKGWRFRISVSGVPSGPEMMNTKISEYGNARTGATSREVNIFTVRNTENNCYDTSTPFSPIFPIKRTLLPIVSSDAHAPYTVRREADCVFLHKNFHTQAILCALNPPNTNALLACSLHRECSHCSE